jgi:hypothetical protein
MKPTGREIQYAAQVELLKQALLNIQKRYAYWFKISLDRNQLRHTTMIGDCFFAVKDGKPLLCFYHDSDLPAFIREECYSAFNEIFDDYI